MGGEERRYLLDTVLAHVAPHRVARQLGMSVPRLLAQRSRVPGLHNVAYSPAPADETPGETDFYMRNIPGLTAELLLAVQPDHLVMEHSTRIARLGQALDAGPSPAGQLEFLREHNGLARELWERALAALPRYNERGGFGTG